MKNVSDAELEVLKVIWDKKIATSSEIIDEVIEYRWTNNTVRTLIKRLLEKGAIEIVGKKGKVFYYKSTINREKYNYSRTKALLKKLFDGKIENLIDVYLKYDKDKDLTQKRILKYLRK